jgi:hypothetical protein
MPSRKREQATNLMGRFGASMRKACAVIKLSRVVYLYKSNARDNSALVMRMKEITQTRVQYGYRPAAKRGVFTCVAPDWTLPEQQPALARQGPA